MSRFALHLYIYVFVAFMEFEFSYLNVSTCDLTYLYILSSPWWSLDNWCIGSQTLCSLTLKVEVGHPFIILVLLQAFHTVFFLCSEHLMELLFTKLNFSFTLCQTMWSFLMFAWNNLTQTYICFFDIIPLGWNFALNLSSTILWFSYTPSHHSYFMKYSDPFWHIQPIL